MRRCPNRHRDLQIYSEDGQWWLYWCRDCGALVRYYCTNVPSRLKWQYPRMADVPRLRLLPAKSVREKTVGEWEEIKV